MTVQNALRATLALSFALVAAGPAMPQVTDLTSMTSHVQGQLGSLGTFIGVVCFLLGVVICVMGVLKLRAHTTNPQDTSNSLPKALGLIFVGVALIGIPTIMGVGVGTLFGTGATTTNLSGTTPFTAVN